MKVEFDPEKRDLTLRERGLDFCDAPRVFDGGEVTFLDLRFDYGEDRWLTFGWLDRVAVNVVWTWRGERRRIISMRQMHDEEIENVGLDRPR